MEGIEIHNITLMRGDMVKTNTQTEKVNEVMFIGVLLNNIVYLSSNIYFQKKLFVKEENIICVKKVNVKKKIYKIWEHEIGIEDFVLKAQSLL